MYVAPAVDEVTNTMEVREASPANFLIKIESFSLLEKFGVEKYETKKFAAGGYNWSLIIYPNGDDNSKDCEHVSVHLALADTCSMPAHWEVNAVFSIFLFNQISGNYLSSLGERRRFQEMKSEWGLSKFISKNILLHPSNGYIVGDTCVFGAEVFVVKREAVTEYLSLKKYVTPNERDWTIPNFSQLGDVWESEEFIAAGQEWMISLYPKGNGEGTGSHISIFLEYLGSERVQATYTIWIKNQISNEHKNETGTNWFSGTNWSSSQDAWGFPTFIELATTNDPKKGFIVKDLCLLHIEISVEAVAK